MIDLTTQDENVRVQQAVDVSDVWFSGGVIRMLRTVHRAGGGLAADLALYLVGAAFAGFTAVASTLPAHRAWGQIAVFGYAVTAALAAIQLLARARGRIGPLTDSRARALMIGIGWLGSTIVPLLVQAAQRANGHPHRAQEEVAVVEMGAARLLDSGTPYLTREAIAAAPEPLLGYLPYQPGMVGFGLPRALAGAAWWTDARVWFALATAAALLATLRLLRSPVGVDQGVVAAAPHHKMQPSLDHRDKTALLIRGAQVVTVLPICALTLATGGDDLPVLALCVLALALAARKQWTATGLAVGAAAALKLFAWPVAAVLLFHAFTAGRGAAVRFAIPAVGLPVAVLLPVLAVSPHAVLENLVRFPLGMGLVESPAASPLPGHLIATLIPGGRAIAAALLVAAALGLAIWLARRPPTTAGDAAMVCAIGLLLAILLMPATRFGYLLYPAGYAAWAVALARAPQRVPV